MIRRAGVAALIASGVATGGAVASLSRTAAAGVVGSPSGPAASAGVAVRVQGNQLVDASGAPIRLLGVDRSGTEYACAQGWGIFDGPSDSASIAAISSWRVNAVRVPLNEDCWLGISGVNPNFSGAKYQSAIRSYVSSLNAAGMVAVLDLHWSAPGNQLALSQQKMADADHSPAFWTSVASAFKSNPGVVFDLYNEPHDISWSCWLNGCTTSGGWQAAGMQILLNSVRSTGATQPVLAGGLNWSGDLSGWLANEPVDPDRQLAASAHIYNFTQCNTPSCWNSTIAPVAAAVPVVTGEIGENDCAPAFIDSYMAWADAHGVSYLGWSWNTASCGSGPALITSYSGTPTPFGAGLQSHLAAVASSPSAGGVYVLDGYGNLDAEAPAGASAPAKVTTTATWPGTNIARGAAALLDDTGGYVLDGWGGVHAFSIGANTLPQPAATSASWSGWDIARAIALLPSGKGGYVLDGWGGVHPFAVGSNPMPPVATTSAYWPEHDIARSIVMLPSGTGGYVLDGYGGVHPFAIGSSPMPAAATTSASWSGWDIARSVTLTRVGAGGYVLDGWGGVHPFSVGSNAMPPAVNTSAYWMYQDVARGIALNSAGNAGFVCNEVGQVAPFAAAKSAAAPPGGSAALPPGAVGRTIIATS